MKNFVKNVSMLVCLLMLVGIMQGCGKIKETNTTENTAKPTETSTASQPKLDKDYIVKIAVSLKGATSGTVKNYMNALKEKGIKAETIVIPADGTEYDQKLRISLMGGGDEIDIINFNNATAGLYMNADIITPLDDIAKQFGYDMNNVFGKNLLKKDEKTYGIAYSKDLWVTYYNKKIFDDAKVPYPTAEGWSWEKYVETAQKLTNPTKGIYGSFMVEDWGQHTYLKAKQKKISEYKNDGTSNFDDPAFAESMKWFYDLGNVLKIQPDLLTYKSKKMSYDAFMSGNYGMWVCGAWSVTSFSDFKSYPREWKVGVLPFPYFEGSPKTNLSLLALRGITNNSKHKLETFNALTYLCEDYYKFIPGAIPSKVTIPDQELNDYIEKVFTTVYKFDGLTVGDVKKAFFNTDAELVSEKMTGLGNSVIDQAFLSEGELYGLGQKSLEATMKEIKRKADDAIKLEKETK